MPRPLLDRSRSLLLASLIILCFHSHSPALTIDGEQQLAYAESLFNNRQYLRAAEEFQRFTFFFVNHPQYRHAIFRAGESFLLAKDPEKAIGLFKALTDSTPLDEHAIESYFKMADGYLLLNAPTHAVVQLNNLMTLSDDPGIQDRALYRIAWIHIEMADWEGSRSAMQRMTSGGKERYQLKRLNEELAEAGAIPTKSPALAGTLSVIPGAGQLYCRRYEDAFIAFAVNVGLIWAAADAFDNQQYGLGGLISFVGLGFYSANIYGAVNDAHRFNRRQTRQFIDQLKFRQVPQAGPARRNSPQALAFHLQIPF